LTNKYKKKSIGALPNENAISMTWLFLQLWYRHSLRVFAGSGSMPEVMSGAGFF
jgi:hypothetical protein